jgi:hypothetical protein
MQSFGRAADVPFGPKRLKYNQKVEIETGQIQGLHAVLASSFITRSTELSLRSTNAPGAGAGSSPCPFL